MTSRSPAFGSGAPLVLAGGGASGSGRGGSRSARPMWSPLGWSSLCAASLRLRRLGGALTQPRRRVYGHAEPSLATAFQKSEQSRNSTVQLSVLLPISAFNAENLGRERTLRLCAAAQNLAAESQQPDFAARTAHRGTSGGRRVGVLMAGAGLRRRGLAIGWAGMPRLACPGGRPPEYDQHIAHVSNVA